MKVMCRLPGNREISSAVAVPHDELCRIALRNPDQVGIAIAIYIARNQTAAIQNTRVEGQQPPGGLPQSDADFLERTVGRQRCLVQLVVTVKIGKNGHIVKGNTCAGFRRCFVRLAKSRNCGQPWNEQHCEQQISL